MAWQHRKKFDHILYIIILCVTNKGETDRGKETKSNGETELHGQLFGQFIMTRCFDSKRNECNGM